MFQIIPSQWNYASQKIWAQEEDNDNLSSSNMGQTNHHLRAEFWKIINYSLPLQFPSDLYYLLGYMMFLEGIFFCVLSRATVNKLTRGLLGKGSDVIGWRGHGPWPGRRTLKKMKETPEKMSIKTRWSSWKEWAVTGVLSGYAEGRSDPEDVPMESSLAN